MDSHFDGSITNAGSTGAGGITGWSYYTPFARISVYASVNGTNYLGGFVGRGYTYIPMRDLLFVGNVTSSGGDNVGLGFGRSVWTNLERSYLAGTVTNPNGAASATHVDFGTHVPGSTPLYTYHRSSMTGAYVSQFSTGLNDNEAQDSASYSTFDFTGVWVIPTNNTFAGILSPVLRTDCSLSGITCP